MIDSLRSMIPDAMSRTLFEQRIIEYGYSEEHRGEYEKSKYSIVAQIIYLVGDDFPRIIETGLITGVSNVRYNVAIDQCDSFQIDEDIFSQLITGESKWIRKNRS